MSDVRTYDSRSSATSLLRKLGIPTAHYDRFLTVSEKKKKPVFTVDVDAVKQAATDLEASKTSKTPIPMKTKEAQPTEPVVVREKTSAKTSKVPEQPKAEPLKKVAKPEKTKPAVEARGHHDRGRTVSSVARELILAGKDNGQVFDALVKEFNLAAEKKYYPAWYRCQLRRDGHKV